MRAPAMTEAFDLLYMMAATGGRDIELFGSSGQLLHNAAEKAMTGKNTPGYYLEFPLGGKPYADLLVLYRRISSDLQLDPGCGFGYRKMLEWYSTLPSVSGFFIGFEMDTGSGPADKAGIYFQPRTSPELVKPFLESVGEEKRASYYFAISDRLPSHMPSAYIGLFPGRPDSPMRIGGYMNAETSKNMAENPAFLRKTFEAVGFRAWDEEMLSICRNLYSVAGRTDFQFDILPDGSLGDTFGLSISANHIRPAETTQWLEVGDGSRIMAKLKAYGLIDDRYKKLAGASFAKGIPVEQGDGRVRLLTLSSRFNYVKVKFKAGKPITAKFYLRLKADFPENAIEMES
jgi:hypothetical protein